MLDEPILILTKFNKHSYELNFPATQSLIRLVSTQEFPFQVGVKVSSYELSNDPADQPTQPTNTSVL